MTWCLPLQKLQFKERHGGRSLQNHGTPQRACPTCLTMARKIELSNVPAGAICLKGRFLGVTGERGT